MTVRTPQSQQTATRPAVFTSRSGPGKRFSILKYISGSMAICLVLWLACADMAAGWLKPLQYIDTPDQVFDDQDPLAEKLPVLQSPGRDFNVLLLGSSLLCALATIENIEEHANGSTPAWKLHTRATAVDEVLHQQLKIPARSFNMGIDACMISEDQVLLEKALEANKRPNMVMILTAPRDFIDNRHKYKNHVHKFFENHRPVWQQLSTNKTPQQNFELIANALSSIYRQRGHYAKVCELTVCSAMHRAPNLYWAQKSGQQGEYWKQFEAPKLIAMPGGKPGALGKPRRTKAEATEKMMEYYKASYWPINYKRFDIEMNHLDQIFKICSQNKIVPIVINMPRGDSNEAMLPSEFRTFYQSSLQKRCKDNNAAYIDFEGDQRFNEADFADAVHLSPPGTKKFLLHLGEALRYNTSLEQTVGDLKW